MQPGTRLEHYEIVAPLGEGGMGAVYEAEDTRLKRTVAIKVLPPELSTDPERLARLEREAQLLGSLNHPNVATVHGFGRETIQEGGRERTVAFVVMELVDGPSLHERLTTGPLLWQQAVDVAIGIAAGLEAAHEKGIVHRDLKPANVHADEAGSVKVLDFGLAKAFEGEAASGSLELSASPTVAAATRTGMILGTASYMSPEQARGKAVDKRADVWALGCVLYEMLTGKKAFAGDTVSDVLASILKEEPDWDALPPIPIRLRHLLERCLAKQPAQRMRDVGDVRLELEAAREEPTGAPRAAAGGGFSASLLVGAAILALLVGLGAGYLLRADPPRPPEANVLLATDGISEGPDPLSISPDGRQIVENGSRGVRMRMLDEATWRTIDAANSISTVFTEDSRRLYLARPGAQDRPPTLESLDLNGTSPVTISDLPPGLPNLFRGFDGSIQASSTRPGGGYTIQRLGANGTLTELWAGEHEGVVLIGDQADDDRWLGWVFELGGNRVLGVTLVGPGLESAPIVLPDFRSPRSLGGGRILAVDARGRLAAARIDLEDGSVVEPPTIVQEGLALSSGFAGGYDFTADGTLVYLAGEAVAAAGEQSLVWLNREQALLPLTERRGRYQVDSRVSPDGESLALEVDAEGEVSIWIHDLDRDVQTALTPGQETSFPVWSPDSAEIAFYAESADPPGIYRAPIDRSRAPELVLADPEGRYALPMDWSPDGSLLLYVESESNTRAEAVDLNDLMLLPVDGGEPRPFANTAADEIDGRFSPDGGWIAYASNQTEQWEVYVRAVDGGAEYRISADEGTSPEWNQTGGEIFFTTDRQLKAVDIDLSGATPSVSAERDLVALPVDTRQNLWHPHPDGERFLIASFGTASNADDRTLRAIFNWQLLAR